LGWYERQPDLNGHLDARMACVADHFGLAAWMLEPENLAFKDAARAARACQTLNDVLEFARANREWGDSRLRQSIGKPKTDDVPARPLWLTPFANEIERLVEAAVDGPSSHLANRACALLGLSHIRPGSPVIVAITSGTARDLLAVSDARIAGPTSLEAGGFEHYRHYPGLSHGADGFGRTYELDLQKRAAAMAATPFGAPEAVRPPMRVSDILEFVYLGNTAVEPRYDRVADSEFLACIKANAPLSELMKTVGEFTDLWDADASA
jgi:hypothetical protein